MLKCLGLPTSKGQNRHFNLFLQGDEPTIYILISAMENLSKKLAKRIMIPEKLRYG